MEDQNSGGGESSSTHVPPQDQNKKHSRWWRRRGFRATLVDMLYAGPQYLLYISLQIFPFAIALPIMFTDQLDFVDTDYIYVGFDNFKALFHDPLWSLFYPAFRRTISFFFLNYFMVFALGLSLALAMFELVSKFKGFFFTIIYLPWMVSGIGIGLLMVMLFSRDTGSVSLGMQALGVSNGVFDVKTDTAAAIALPIIYSWKSAGFNMAILLGGLLAIPKETIESAKMDGANYFQRVIHIYLPQIIPAIIIVSIFALINSFNVFDELVGLGALEGNKNARLVSVFIWELGFATAVTGTTKVGTLAQGITVSMVVFMPLVFAAFYLTKLQKKFRYN